MAGRRASGVGERHWPRRRRSGSLTRITLCAVSVYARACVCICVYVRVGGRVCRCGSWSGRHGRASSRCGGGGGSGDRRRNRGSGCRALPPCKAAVAGRIAARISAISHGRITAPFELYTKRCAANIFAVARRGRQRGGATTRAGIGAGPRKTRTREALADRRSARSPRGRPGPDARSWLAGRGGLSRLGGGRAGVARPDGYRRAVTRIMRRGALGAELPSSPPCLLRHGSAVSPATRGRGTRC